jgi:hypothetical protein
MAQIIGFDNFHCAFIMHPLFIFLAINLQFKNEILKQSRRFNLYYIVLWHLKKNVRFSLSFYI